MPHSGENRRDTVFIAGGDDFVDVFRATGLDGSLDAGFAAALASEIRHSGHIDRSEVATSAQENSVPPWPSSGMHRKMVHSRHDSSSFSFASTLV